MPITIPEVMGQETAKTMKAATITGRDHLLLTGGCFSSLLAKRRYLKARNIGTMKGAVVKSDAMVL